MNDNPLVSIVLLTYNGEQYIDRCLSSLSKLSYNSLEVIIVDNASTDGTLEIIKKFRYKNLKVISNKTNIGGNAGRNKGISTASGKYVLLLDGDIEVVQNNTIELLLEIYKKNSNTAFIQLPIIDVNKDTTTYYGIYFSLYDFKNNLPKVTINKILQHREDLIEIAAPTGACLFFSNEIWSLIGGYDEVQPYHIDEFDLGPRALIFGYKNCLFTKSYLIHHGVFHAASKDLKIFRFSYLFSGHARGMFKNYKLINLIIRFPIFLIYHFTKALFYSIKLNSLGLFYAFIKSIFRFIYTLSDTLRLRKEVQKNRRIKNDIFLDIKPPKFR